MTETRPIRMGDRLRHLDTGVRAKVVGYSSVKDSGAVNVPTFTLCFDGGYPPEFPIEPFEAYVDMLTGRPCIDPIDVHSLDRWEPCD